MPRHDLTLAQMTTSDIRKVVDAWVAQSVELGARHPWVQIFENKGAVMGCSNPRPHGQVLAGNFLPNGVAVEDLEQKFYLHRNGLPLLLDYALIELTATERVVV